MLIIRRKQVEVLKEEARRGFTDRVLRRLRKYYPEKIDTIGDKAAQDIIRGGIDIAKIYNITIEYDVFCFIALMFLFGTDFYRTQPWAMRIFYDQNIRRPSERMTLLCIAAEAQSDESNQSRTRELLNV